MSLPSLIVSILSMGLLILGAGAASGQDYPTKPIRIITTEAGASLDFQARMIGKGITGPLDQAVVIENKSSVLVPELVARAAPDGYTLAYIGGPLWLTPLTQKTPYDALKDFAPVTLAVTYPYLLAMHVSLRPRTVRDLIGLAKARPRELNIASTASPGGQSFLAAELLKSMAGIDVVRVPYKGLNSSLIAVLTGEAHLMFLPPTMMSVVKSGKVRALAVTSLERIALAPDLATVSASGLPGYEAISIIGVVAPAETPVTRVNRLNREIVQWLGTEEARTKFASEGIEVVGSSPEQFAARIKSEVAKWGRLLRDTGVKTY